MLSPLQRLHPDSVSDELLFLIVSKSCLKTIWLIKITPADQFKQRCVSQCDEPESPPCRSCFGVRVSTETPSLWWSEYLQCHRSWDQTQSSPAPTSAPPRHRLSRLLLLFVLLVLLQACAAWQCWHLGHPGQNPAFAEPT